MSLGLDPSKIGRIYSLPGHKKQNILFKMKRSYKKQGLWMLVIGICGLTDKLKQHVNVHVFLKSL